MKSIIETENVDPCPLIYLDIQNEVWEAEGMKVL